MTFKKSLLAAVVAVSAVGMMTESSNAFFGWRGGSCGSSGGGGSWGGGWGSRGSWGSHGGGWGSRGSWGSHGGGWGSSGSHGSWGGSYGSGGGSWGSYGGGGSYGGYSGVTYSSGGYARTGVVYEGVVVRSSTPATKVIASKPAAKTSLTLHVPADAKVTLAGVTTKQTGAVRQFATTKLTAGQVWDNYKVVVELEKGGQTVREERMLTLTGGKSQELTVNVDSSDQIAQR